jgi:lipopolysaccharide export LptBFGC system permease protein LptF
MKVAANAYYSTAEAVASLIGVGITIITFALINVFSVYYNAKADAILSDIDQNIGEGTNNDIVDKYAIKTDAYSFKDNQRESKINVSVILTAGGSQVDINDVEDIE